MSTKVNLKFWSVRYEPEIAWIVFDCGISCDNKTHYTSFQINLSDSCYNRKVLTFCKRFQETVNEEFFKRLLDAEEFEVEELVLTSGGRYWPFLEGRFPEIGANNIAQKLLYTLRDMDTIVCGDLVVTTSREHENPRRVKLSMVL